MALYYWQQPDLRLGNPHAVDAANRNITRIGLPPLAAQVAVARLTIERGYSAEPPSPGAGAVVLTTASGAQVWLSGEQMTLLNAWWADFQLTPLPGGSGRS